MEHFEKAMSFLMTPQCYEDIFYKLNFTNVICLKMIISKGLGYAILAGALLLRIPQIMKIVSARSGDGISVASEILMMLAIFGSMSYGCFKEYPIAAYGDSYFLFGQGVIILMLCFFYQNKRCSAVITLVCSSIVSYLLYAKMIPEMVIIGLNGSGILLSVLSKLNQIILNYKNSSTGVLSAFTLLLQFLGCVARIFTSIQETGDIAMIINYVAISVVNGLLVVQLIYYWNSAQKTKKE